MIRTFALATLLAATTLAHATTVEFTANLVFITEPGDSVLAGTTTTTPFAGRISYGNSESDAQFIQPGADEASYFFTDPAAYGLSLTNGAFTFQSAGQVVMDIVNNAAMNATAAAVFNGMHGTSDDFQVGSIYDDWGINAFPQDAVIDPDGNTDPDGDFFEGGSLFVEVAARSFDETLYANTDFQRLPPALGGDVYGQIRIVERAADGAVLFDGTGILTSLTVVPDPPAVPLPAGVWLFVSALAGLIGVRRNKGVSRQTHR